jgi:glucokinase
MMATMVRAALAATPAARPPPLQDRSVSATERTPVARGGLLLVGDVGGTHTRLALYESTPSARRSSAAIGRRPRTLRALRAPAHYPSAQFASLEAVAAEYLRATGAQPERAVFGVAGPVVAGRAEVTNLPWRITEAGLRAALRVRSVRLLNDLAAIAWAIPVLGARDTRIINRGRPGPGGTIGVVAPGTGLGEAFLTWDGARYRAYPSEGGHSDFAPPTRLAAELLEFLRRRRAHVSVERVCSGTGIPHLYAFLKARGGREPAWLAERLAAGGDPAPVIVEAALDRRRPCRIARATLELFIDILGAEAGNLAVKVLATGGVYLAGGIPPKIIPALTDGRFMRAFTQKGRLSGLLRGIPVRLVVHPAPGLVGAAQSVLLGGTGESSHRRNRPGQRS